MGHHPQGWASWPLEVAATRKKVELVRKAILLVVGQNLVWIIFLSIYTQSGSSFPPLPQKSFEYTILDCLFMYLLNHKVSCMQKKLMRNHFIVACRHGTNMLPTCEDVGRSKISIQSCHVGAAAIYYQHQLRSIKAVWNWR